MFPVANANDALRQGLGPGSRPPSIAFAAIASFAELERRFEAGDFDQQKRKGLKNGT